MIGLSLSLAPRQRHGCAVASSSSAILAKDPPQAQSESPLGKIGVAAALAPSGEADAVERMALALVEAGAQAVYCVRRPARAARVKVAEYVRRMVADNSGAVTGRLEYVCANVRGQGDIGEREGRMDSHTDCLEYPADQFERVISVNTNGVLYTAQAAGRQMARFGNGGSIILIGRAWVSYNTSKSAVYGSMACELGSKRIRVNTLSPGSIYTSPDELRGVITWLASDASTFCT
ncbi:hypothetical protein EDB84DRAFT_1587335 [Lactarius hengduanensis]|nr:hypothetical protein EDB84DRAFT_1587335 [Lactarius hengduanensis]